MRDGGGGDGFSGSSSVCVGGVSAEIALGTGTVGDEEGGTAKMRTWRSRRKGKGKGMDEEISK